MALPVLVQKQAETLLRRFCIERLSGRGGVLTHAREGDCFTLFEMGGDPAAEEEGRKAVARFCFNRQLGQWTLHFRDARQWRFYLNAGPSLNLEKLLLHVAEDPFGAFWS